MIDFTSYWIWMKIHWKNVFYFLGSCAGFYSLYKSKPKLKIVIEKEKYYINPKGDEDHCGEYGFLCFEGYITNKGVQPMSIIKAVIHSKNTQVNGEEMGNPDLFHQEIKSSRTFYVKYIFSKPPLEDKIKGKIKFYITRKLFPITHQFNLKANK